MQPSRRDFLATTALTLVSSTSRSPSFVGQRHPITRHLAPRTATTLLPTPLAAADLGALATQAIDAARAAGAAYADVRVAERVQFVIGSGGGPALVGTFQLLPQFMYGVRVLVEGAWAFVHGVTPSGDAITRSARDAVAAARGYASYKTSPIELPPIPVATGEWTTPIQLDPFDVPLGDQTALLSAYRNTAARIPRTTTGLESSFTWTRESRVFASTEGSFVTQRLHTCDPDFVVGGILPGSLGQTTLPQVLWSMAGGYECVTRPTLQDEIKRLAEESAWCVSLPRRTLDVGRYPVVFDGRTMGALCTRTLGCALELDRVLGYEMGAGGGSYLSPPEEMLDTTVASSWLTVAATRAMPNMTAVMWDDDGIQPTEVPLITQGRLMNYLTSRQTVAQIAAASPRGTRLRHTGCALAPEADSPVSIRVPHLMISPNSIKTRLEDLCQGMTHGILICNARYVAVDQQMTSGFIPLPGAMLEIEKGKIVRRAAGNGIQFGTARLWRQSLVALGDASTMRSGVSLTWKGLPEVKAWQSASAPAGLFKDVDVVRTRYWWL